MENTQTAMIEKIELITDYEILDKELDAVDKLEVLRIEIDSGLEQSLQELQSLESQLPDEQKATLIEQCTTNALNAITGQFGLAAVVLDSKDGGNVHTTHNVRQGIYASEKEHQAYENRDAYDSHTYHKDPNYIQINKKQKELKEQGKLYDYMTGKRIKINDKTDLDHIVSAKAIHDDRARVLAEVDGTTLANTEQNLALTDSSLNRSKKAMSAEKMLQRRDERLEVLKHNEQKRGYLTESEQKEKIKLEKQKKINDEAFKKREKESQENIDRQIDKAYYTSAKPYKEALTTGAQDAAKMAVYSAIGVVLRDFVKGMMIELKILFKEFGNESLKDIFKRFRDRLYKIWENLKVKWKEILAGSLEAGLMAFFSNLIVFLVNIVFTTLKRIVRIIRAGFASLWQAIKIIINPPKDMPKEDIYYEAAKVLVSGLIMSVTMLGSEAIKNFLLTIPGLNVILNIPIPFTGESIGDAIALSIAAAGGAVLSTIAIYYMDKFRNADKVGRLHLQLATQSGVCVQYKIAQSYFVLYDAHCFVAQEGARVMQNLQNEKRAYEERQKALNEGLDELAALTRQAKALIYNTKGE